MTDLAERLRRHLRDADLFPDSGRALLAVSGGPDSVALLDLFAAVAPAFDLELVVAHVDHGIAPESGEVARQVARLAEHYGVPCRAVRLELGSDTSETRARRARYRALRELQREADGRYLVTAHHADDQTETAGRGWQGSRGSLRAARAASYDRCSRFAAGSWRPGWMSGKSTRRSEGQSTVTPRTWTSGTIARGCGTGSCRWCASGSGRWRNSACPTLRATPARSGRPGRQRCAPCRGCSGTPGSV